jgi:F0F1-type ATP synthase membrane subunit b/b'
MQEIITILKTLATSNTINFLLMVWILAVIVRKINLGNAFAKGISEVKTLIDKSENKKKLSQKNLDEINTLIEKLPQDVAELEKLSAQKTEALTKDIVINTKNSIEKLEKNVEKVISVEEKKISNSLQEESVKASVELAKQRIIKSLAQNPDLHNDFIRSSLDELEKVVL